MKQRIIAMLAGLSFAVGVSAQDAATSSVREAMVDTANAFLATLGPGPGRIETMIGVDRGKRLSLALDDDAREQWQFWPTVRAGLPLEGMSAEQRMLTHDLLTSILSSSGYQKAVNIMQLERILDVLDEAGLPRSVDHYVLVLFGTPSMATAWGWRFEGHHVSLNVSVSPDGVAVTPSFFGSNPAEVRSGPLAGFRALGVQEDLARELVMSLSDAQREIAIIADRPPGDLFSANINKPREQWNAWRETLRPEGIAVASLNEVQQHWVGRILSEIVANYRPEISVAKLASIDPAELSFAWMGSTERRQPHYFRLQGPDFVFEHDNVQNMGNHVHSVWRSKSGDFGMDILARHYQSSLHQ